MKVDLNQSFRKYCRRNLTILTFLFLLPQIALAQTWNAKTSIPQGGNFNNTDKGAALTWGGGDLIYAFQGNFQNFFFKYSISSNSWTSLAPSAAGQQPGAGIAWAGGDFIFAIHGGNGTNFGRYSISGNSWTTLTATPAVQGPGSSIVWTGGDNLFVLFAASFNAGDSAFYSYTISTGTWTLKTSIPQVSTKPFSGAALAWSGGDFIYALKGNGTNEFYRYSISGNSWATRANAPTAVGATTDAALGSNLRWNGGNFLYALPGNGSTAFWQYNIAGDSWTTLNALPAAVGGGGSIVYDNRTGQDFAYVLKGGLANDFYAASFGTTVSASTSTVTANPTSIPADGTTTSTITVTLKDAAGSPVSGKTVTLAKSGGSSTISAASGTSSATGVVTFTVKNTVAESTTYTATDTTDGVTVTQTATVTFTAGAATKYLVTSSSSNPTAGSAVTITAQLSDANNNAVSTAGKVVTWSKTGAGGSFSAATSTTNASGVVTVTFTTSTTAGTVHTVTATDEGSLTGTSANITTVAGALSNFLVEAAGGGAIAAQSAGTPFNIRITARDANNNTVTSFTGTVNITSTGTLSAGSGATAAFISGVLASHSVTISNIGNFTITATKATTNESGTSNAFAVNAATITSTAAGGAWTTAGTWDLNRVPVSTDNVVIATTGANSVNSVPGGGVTVASLTVNSGATFSFGSTTITVSGLLSNNGTINAGSFILNAGSISNSGTMNIGSFTMNVSGSFTNSGSWNATGGTGFALNVTGNFTNSGAFNAALYTLKVGGSFTNSGTFDANFSSSGTVELNGVSAQTVTPTASITFDKLTINNSSGVTLAGTITVNGTLTLTTGNVTAGANTLIVASSGTIARTNGHIVGNLQKAFATGAQSFTFHIGDATRYTPVDITFASVTVTGNVTAKTTGTEHANISQSGINSAKSVNRFWTLSGGGGILFTTYDATFNFVASDVDSGATTENFLVRRFDGTSWFATTTGTKTATSTQATGLSSFSDFAIGEQVIDHYAVSVPSPQTAGAVFSVTVTAQDAINVTVPDSTVRELR